ncbi:MAG: ABC transporter permease [Lachnospiraceae bacterium]
MYDYFQNNMSAYVLAIKEHLIISLQALTAAALIGIPAGFFCARFSRMQKWMTALFQVLRVIPSLAVLLLLIPVMGTGPAPALTALILLAVPPIMMNTAEGLSKVPEFMLETAEGCGMTEGQIWRRVCFPLALPMILTGVKTALIEIIASAALAAKIGAGGLGGIIFTGLGLNRFDLLFIGGITVAALSVASGLLLELFDRRLLRYHYLGGG